MNVRGFYEYVTCQERTTFQWNCVMPGALHAIAQCLKTAMGAYAIMNEVFYTFLFGPKVFKNLLYLLHSQRSPCLKYLPVLP